MAVYAIQQQMHYDAVKGELLPRFDLSPAEEFGEIKYLLSPSASPFTPDSIISELHEKLKGFSDEDYLLLIGNPVLIGMAAAIAADNAGTVNFLQWSGKNHKYISIKAEIFLAE